MKRELNGCRHEGIRGTISFHPVPFSESSLVGYTLKPANPITACCTTQILYKYQSRSSFDIFVFPPPPLLLLYHPRTMAKLSSFWTLLFLVIACTSLGKCHMVPLLGHWKARVCIDELVRSPSTHSVCTRRTTREPNYHC